MNNKEIKQPSPHELANKAAQDLTRIEKILEVLLARENVATNKSSRQGKKSQPKQLSLLESLGNPTENKDKMLHSIQKTLSRQSATKHNEKNSKPATSAC